MIFFDQKVIFNSHIPSLFYFYFYFTDTVGVGDYTASNKRVNNEVNWKDLEGKYVVFTGWRKEGNIFKKKLSSKCVSAGIRTIHLSWTWTDASRCAWIRIMTVILYVSTAVFYYTMYLHRLHVSTIEQSSSGLFFTGCHRMLCTHWYRSVYISEIRKSDHLSSKLKVRNV